LFADHLPRGRRRERGRPSLARVVAVTTVVLFHSAQGQTPGFLAFADELRSAGHTIHAPALFDGETFGPVDEGVAHAREVGFREFVRLGAEEAKELPTDVVYAGF